MNADEKTQMMEKAKRYAFWSKAHSIAFTASKIDRPLAIACIVIGVVNLVTLLTDGSASSPLLGSITILGVFIGFALHKAADYTENKKKTYLDSRMNMREYDFILSSIRSAGIENPDMYVVENPENIDAYRRVLQVARFSIELPDTFKGKRNVTADLLEEHRVAALVLPGPEEARRSERIINLIEARKVNHYANIKAIVEQHDRQPLPLQHGTL